MTAALERLQLIQRGELPPPPMARQLGLDLVTVTRGAVVIAFDAQERHANPMGTLRGGVLCDIADAAMGLAYSLHQHARR